MITKKQIVKRIKDLTKEVDKSIKQDLDKKIEAIYAKPDFWENENKYREEIAKLEESDLYYFSEVLPRVAKMELDVVGEPHEGL